MIKLMVMPESVFDHYVKDGVLLSDLKSIKKLCEYSSAHDLLDISITMNNFAFKDLLAPTMELMYTPMAELTILDSSDDPDRHRLNDLYRRLKTRFENYQLQNTNGLTYVPKYWVKPVDDTFWVVVEQRLADEIGNPKVLTLKHNASYLDETLKLLNETHRFDELAKLEIFKQYLIASNIKTA